MRAQLAGATAVMNPSATPEAATNVRRVTTEPSGDDRLAAVLIRVDLLAKADQDL